MPAFTRHPLIVLAIAGLLLATIMGLLAACGPTPGTPASASTGAVLVPTTAAAAPAVTDQQFADQFNHILAGVPGSHPIAVANVPAIVGIACQPANLYATMLPAADWHQIQALLAQSGRCPR